MGVLDNEVNWSEVLISYIFYIIFNNFFTIFLLTIIFYKWTIWCDRLTDTVGGNAIYEYIVTISGCYLDIKHMYIVICIIIIEVNVEKPPRHILVVGHKIKYLNYSYPFICEYKFLLKNLNNLIFYKISKMTYNDKLRTEYQIWLIFEI